MLWREWEIWVCSWVWDEDNKFKFNMLIKVYVLLKGMDVFINVVKRVELIGNVIYKICYGIVCLKKRDEINN